MTLFFKCNQQKFVRALSLSLSFTRVQALGSCFRTHSLSVNRAKAHTESEDEELIRESIQNKVNFHWCDGAPTLSHTELLHLEGCSAAAAGASACACNFFHAFAYAAHAHISIRIVQTYHHHTHVHTKFSHTDVYAWYRAYSHTYMRCAAI